jgi:hypothetical protein
MLRVLFVFLLFLHTLFGENTQNFSFVGLSASTQTVNTDPGDLKHEAGFALRYGQQSLDWRTMFNLDYTVNTYYGASVEIDKILLDNMFGTPKLRPYLGGVAGYLKYDEDELSEWADETNGFYFGGNFGFIIYATDNIDADIGYHYYKVQNLDFLDDLHGATIAVHYFF